MNGNRKRGWRCATAVFSLMLCLGTMFGVATTFAAPSAASSSLDSIMLKAGGTITVRATGFSSQEHVSSWASSARGSVYPTTGKYVDSAGNVTLAIQIGRFWEPGWWAITVHGVNSGRQTIATFEVLAASPDGALDVSSTSVAAGGSINFHGAGFTDGELISGWATRPDGSAVALLTAVHSSGGQIYFSYGVPADAAAGAWAMTVYGQSSGRFLIVAFTVTR